MSNYKKLIEIINGAPDGVNCVQPSKVILGGYDYVRCGGFQLPTPKNIQDLDLIEGEEYLCVGGEMMKSEEIYTCGRLRDNSELGIKTGHASVAIFGSDKFIHLTPALKKEFNKVEQSEVASAMSFDHEQKVYTVEMQERCEFPEVGMTCLASEYEGDELKKCEVVFINDDVIFCRDIDHMAYYHFSKSNTDISFKPIDTRTPKQKAIDEIKEEMKTEFPFDSTEFALALAYDKWVGK